MGGPGGSALSCVQHISEAAELMRDLKEHPPSNAPNELRSRIADILDLLAEAKWAGLEARDEINSLVAYSERRDDELGQITGVHPSTQIPPHTAPPSGESLLDEPANSDAARAAQMVSLASFAAADQGFRSLDTFASWFVGGTAAAVGLMIANIDKIEPYAGGIDFQWTLTKVVIALGLIGVAKFFGSLVCTMARGSERVLETVDQWERRGWSIPSESALAAARDAALPAPYRLLPKKFVHRLYEPLTQARQVMWFVMIAGVSTLASVVLVITALVDIIQGL